MILCIFYGDIIIFVSQIPSSFSFLTFSFLSSNIMFLKMQSLIYHFTIFVMSTLNTLMLLKNVLQILSDISEIYSY